MGVLTFAALSWVVRTVYRKLERRGIFNTEIPDAHEQTAWVYVSAMLVISYFVRRQGPIRACPLKGDKAGIFIRFLIVLR